MRYQLRARRVIWVLLALFSTWALVARLSRPSDGPVRRFSPVPAAASTTEPWVDLVLGLRGVYQEPFRRRQTERALGRITESALNNTLMVSSANWAFADFTINFLCTAKAVVPYQLVVLAQDHKLDSLLRLLGVPSLHIGQLGLAESPGDSTSFRQAKYNVIVRAKVSAVVEILKLGTHVWFNDVDIVFRGDPVVDMLDGIDFQFQGNRGGLSDYWSGEANTGFYVLKSNNKTIRLLEKTIDLFEGDSKLDDQTLLDSVLMGMTKDNQARFLYQPWKSSTMIQAVPSDVLSYTNFPMMLYPPGLAWVYNKDAKVHRDAEYNVTTLAAGLEQPLPLIAHANFLSGAKQKRDAFKARGWCRW